MAGKNLRAWLRANAWKQKRLATAAGLSEGFVSGFLKGKAASVATLEQLSAITGLTIGQLADSERYRPKAAEKAAPCDD